jgi:hypothetical protein
MLWGQEQRYQRFTFGMVPLFGLERRRLAPLWSQAGALLFRYGEHFYNFQGLLRLQGEVRAGCGSRAISRRAAALPCGACCAT